MAIVSFLAMVISVTSCNTLSDVDRDDNVLRAAVYLSGASDSEELGSGAEEEIERLEALLRTPVEINFAPRSRLLSSGLFSSYQVASLIDYRSRMGDVLSSFELAAVNGFGEEFVDVITPFISFGSSASPGASSASAGASHSGEARSTLKFPEGGGDPDLGYGAKYSLAVGDRLDIGASFKAPSSSPPSPPQSWSFSSGYYGRGMLSKLLVGDFNARFGQGLCMWNGFSMSGFGTAAGMARRPTGLVRYGGFSPSYALRGLAAELSLGRFSLSCFGSIPVTGFESYSGGGNSSAGLNLSLSGLKGECGISALVLGRSIFEPDKSVRPLQSVRVSLDARYNIRGVDLFGEGALDVLTMKPAVVLGTTFKAGEKIRLGALARYYARDYGKLIQTGGTFKSSTIMVAAARAGTYCSDERGLALAADISAGEWVKMTPSSSLRRHVANISIDVASLKDGHLQTKLNLVYKAVAAPGWTLATKFKMRLRNYDVTQRYELGETVSYDSGVFSAAAWLGAAHSVGFAGAAYLDGGLSHPYGDGRKVGLHLRAGIFHVDSWDDRLYVFERDIPGSFNVPALYGRGGWGSLLLNWKFARVFRLYLHASLRVRSSPTTPGKNARSDFGISLVSSGLRFSRHSDMPPMTGGKNAGSR